MSRRRYFMAMTRHRTLRCVFATAGRILHRILARVLRPTPAVRGGDPGPFTVQYHPNPDGRPDPGEVVWAWVPFEEDHTRGKDRPVLIMGRQGRELIGLMLTSRDHDRDV